MLAVGPPSAARAVAALGEHGALLCLSAGPDGALQRQLWRLPTAATLGGCVVGDSVVVLTAHGAYACQLPSSHPGPSGGFLSAAAGRGEETSALSPALPAASTAAAAAVAAEAMLATCEDTWANCVARHAGRRPDPSDLAPDVDASALPLAPLPVAVAALRVRRAAVRLPWAATTTTKWGVFL